MAAKEVDGLLQVKDAAGDVNIIYPVTRAENVEGLYGEDGKIAPGSLPDMDYLPVSGGTMTGALTLSGDPVNTADAANKNYVDGKMPLFFDFDSMDLDDTDALRIVAEDVYDAFNAGRVVFAKYENITCYLFTMLDLTTALFIRAGANSTQLVVLQNGSFYVSDYAVPATKLQTARTIQTNLGSTTAASFDGTTDIAPGVTGTLPIANGGTGTTSALAAAKAFGRGYGTCGTAAATAAKVGALSGFVLNSGAVVGIKFTYANTATSPTLNVNSTGARAIYRYDTYAPVTEGDITAGMTAFFMYNGTYWILLNPAPGNLVSGVPTTELIKSVAINMEDKTGSVTVASDFLSADEMFDYQGLIFEFDGNITGSYGTFTSDKSSVLCLIIGNNGNSTVNAYIADFSVTANSSGAGFYRSQFKRVFSYCDARYIDFPNAMMYANNALLRVTSNTSYVSSWDIAGTLNIYGVKF